jgi:hypothetical protein
MRMAAFTENMDVLQLFYWKCTVGDLILLFGLSTVHLFLVRGYSVIEGPQLGRE